MQEVKTTLKMNATMPKTGLNNITSTTPIKTVTMPTHVNLTTTTMKPTSTSSVPTSTKSSTQTTTIIKSTSTTKQTPTTTPKTITTFTTRKTTVKLTLKPTVSSTTSKIPVTTIKTKNVTNATITTKPTQKSFSKTAVKTTTRSKKPWFVPTRKPITTTRPTIRTTQSTTPSTSIKTIKIENPPKKEASKNVKQKWTPVVEISPSIHPSSSSSPKRYILISIIAFVACITLVWLLSWKFCHPESKWNSYNSQSIEYKSNYYSKHSEELLIADQTAFDVDCNESDDTKSNPNVENKVNSRQKPSSSKNAVAKQSNANKLTRNGENELLVGANTTSLPPKTKKFKSNKSLDLYSEKRCLTIDDDEQFDFKLQMALD